jgi:hypothetical protein
MPSVATLELPHGLDMQDVSRYIKSSALSTSRIGVVYFGRLRPLPIEL